MKLIELFDDTTTDKNGHVWSQICDKHNKELKIPYHMLDENAGHGICGVKGCSSESDHYIDFE